MSPQYNFVCSLLICLAYHRGVLNYIVVQTTNYIVVQTTNIIVNRYLSSYLISKNSSHLNLLGFRSRFIDDPDIEISDKCSSGYI